MASGSNDVAPGAGAQREELKPFLPSGTMARNVRPAQWIESLGDAREKARLRQDVRRARFPPPAAKAIAARLTGPSGNKTASRGERADALPRARSRVFVGLV